MGALLREAMLNRPAHEHVGINHPTTIDLVTHAPGEEVWRLVVIEQGAWDGSRAQLLKLQQKLNTYVAFAVDGGMEEKYPESVGRRRVIRLDLYHAPDEKTRSTLEKLGAAIEQEGLGFEVHV